MKRQLTLRNWLHPCAVHNKWIKVHEPGLVFQLCPVTVVSHIWEKEIDFLIMNFSPSRDCKMYIVKWFFIKDYILLRHRTLNLLANLSSCGSFILTIADIHIRKLFNVTVLNKLNLIKGVFLIFSKCNYSKICVHRYCSKLKLFLEK